MSNQKDYKQLEAESNQLWELAKYFVLEKSLMDMTEELWLRKLSLISLDISKEGIEDSLNFLDKAKDFSVIPSLKAFKIILKQICKSESFELYGPSFWSKFMEWDNHLEKNMIQTSSLMLIEKEEIRKKSNRTRQQMQQCFFIYSYGKLAANDLDGAIKVLEESVKFRYPFYLPPIYISNISKILTEAQRQADMGNISYLERIKEVCPPLDKDPLNIVHKVLKQKTVGSKWWGWNAIGVSEKEKMEMVKQHRKYSGRNSFLEAEKRRQSHVHQENKSKKPVVFRGFLPRQ